MSSAAVTQNRTPSEILFIDMEATKKAIAISKRSQCGHHCCHFFYYMLAVLILLQSLGAMYFHMGYEGPLYMQIIFHHSMLLLVNYNVFLVLCVFGIYSLFKRSASSAKILMIYSALNVIGSISFLVTLDLTYKNPTDEPNFYKMIVTGVVSFLLFFVFFLIFICENKRVYVISHDHETRMISTEYTDSSSGCTVTTTWKI